jgi:integrase/recombinase XerD
MPRPKIEQLSCLGQQAIAAYATQLRTTDDLAAKTVENYLSDLRQFAAWCETTWQEGSDDLYAFQPATVTTPTITHYRAYLQTVLHLRPATINRALVSLKRYFAWAVEHGFMQRDPARVVKLVPEVEHPPRHVTDQEEAALVAALDAAPLRDRTIVILLLHTGLRAQELCSLQVHHVKLGKRSGVLQIYGKRNKYREVPLNGTARAALETYLPTLPIGGQFIFPSGKTGTALTVRGLAHCFRGYVVKARLADVSLHDLRHRFGYRMAQAVPLHRLAQIMGHDSLDTTMIYIRGTKQDLQKEVEKIAWT